MLTIKRISQKTVLCCGWFCLLYLLAFASYAGQINIKFAYIGNSDNSAFQGVSQGLNEANLQGQFLGQAYELDIISLDNINGVDLSAYIALFVATDSDTLSMLGQTAPSHPVFNLTADDDTLREDCLANVLHIIPSHNMKNDAIGQWLKKHPDARVEAAAWHPAFVKFAARDLNKRFRKAFAQDMDSEAWAGWAAVRMTADSVVRESISGPDEMLSYLKTDLSFDGQKGLAMNFRETGQLRQILLLVDSGKLVGEAPVRGVVKSDNVDSLGITDCPK